MILWSKTQQILWVNFLLLICFITALPMQIGSLIKLNGTNYEHWVASIKLFLEISYVDAALTEDEPPIPTDTSSAEEKMKYDKWTHSNKICLMIMKHSMEKTVKDNIPEATNAKKFLVDIGNKFKKFYKSEKSSYFSLLTKTKYDGVSGVNEHAMKLTNWYQKLKSMKVVLGEDFLVWQILDSLPSEFDMLRTSYNAHKEEWSVDELISILSQEEHTIKKDKDKGHVVQYVS